MKARYVIAAGALAVLGLAGCASEDRGTRDAPVDARLQDNQAPLIVNMPNGYMNPALKCVGDMLIISHTRAASPVAIDEASPCAEGVAEELGIPRVKPGAGR